MSPVRISICTGPSILRTPATLPLHKIASAYYLCHITFVTYIVAKEGKIPHFFNTFGGFSQICQLSDRYQWHWGTHLPCNTSFIGLLLHRCLRKSHGLCAVSHKIPLS